MKIDMSRKAVDTRLRRVSQLRRLCLALSKAKPVSESAAREELAPEKPAPPR
jgi:hypothetical protein